jgi:hypothetical protein
MPDLRTRKLTIIAQDPGVTLDGKILRTQIEIPNERLAAGPCGYRVQVVDYDSSTDTLYKPGAAPYNGANREPLDPFAAATDRELLDNPQFHAQNVYAIVMRALARFEFALGRRISWSFAGHQIQAAPHAFGDANAFYSKRDRGLLFGYFPRPDGKGMVYSCLAHDVVAHETTHAIVDGLRERYTDASSPDQAAFHEGFADIFALLSILSLPGIVKRVIDYGRKERSRNLIDQADLTVAALKDSMVFGIGKEMGEQMSGVRGDVLRRSVRLLPSQVDLSAPEFQEEHRRGEALVACVMNAFLEVWVKRLGALGTLGGGKVDRDRAVEEGAAAADYLLTMVVRALDYSPPTDLSFGDFASAVLTADWELHPEDEKYRFRALLLSSFRAYGIEPSSKGTGREPGVWDPPEAALDYSQIHFESMQRDQDEVFRFVWDNREALGLNDMAYTRVQSVRPCLRIGIDGFALHETVAECIQMLTVRAEELAAIGIAKPEGMPDPREVTIYGGNALIFDQYGRLKYNIGTGIGNAKRQAARLESLWKHGAFAPGASAQRRFAAIHRQRMMRWMSVLADEEAQDNGAKNSGRRKKAR